MDLSNLDGYADALRAVERATNARMRALTKLHKYVEGTQYDGRPDWFSTEKPLWERAPCVVYPIARSAIDSNTDLVMGEGRFPSLSVPVADDFFADAGIDEADAEKVNRWLVMLEEHTRLRAVARELFMSAQGCGSACAIVGIRAGRIVIDTAKAAWCTPTFDASGDVTSLVIEYPFLRQVQVADRAVVEPMLYRRVIDQTKDTTFKPAKLLEGLKPAWAVEVEVVHSLGFCPVVWYAHAKGCSTVADIDGHAIHAHLLDEITALDFALSQKHRAALFAGDPQWTEIGVEKGTNPSGPGRLPMSTPATAAGGAASTSNPITTRFADTSRSASVRRKSPGDVWQYEDKDTKVQLHTLPGDALQAIDDHARDLKTKIAEALGVVFIDLEAMHKVTALSGRTLDALRNRQLDRCDSYRSDFGDRLLRPLVAMLMRLVAERPLGLRIPGIKDVRMSLTTILTRGLMLNLDWGPYSKPEPLEEFQLVQTATLAKTSGLATRRSAVMMIKDVLGVDNVDEHLEALEEESAEAMKRSQDMAAATAAKNPASGGDKPGAPPGVKPTTDDGQSSDQAAE